MVDLKFGISAIALSAVLLGYGVQNSEARNKYDWLNSVQMQTINNLDGQRSRINSKLDTAINSNQLSRNGANSIKRQLSDNMEMQTRFLSDRLLDPVETTQLVNNLNAIENNLQSQIQAFTAAPGNIPNSNAGAPWKDNPFGLSIGNLNPNSDYAKMHISAINLVQKMQRQIDKGKANGSLTRSEVSKMQGQLNDIVRRQKELVRQPGSVNDIVQTRYLLQSCLDLGSRITYNMNDNETRQNTDWRDGTGNGGNSSCNNGNNNGNPNWNNGNNNGNPNWNNGNNNGNPNWNNGNPNWNNGNNNGNPNWNNGNPNWNNGHDGDGHHHHHND